MNKDKILKMGAGWSSTWDGKSIDRVRAGDDISSIDNKRMSIHLMAQESVAKMMLANETLLDQGTMSRFLVCYPPSNIGNRSYVSVDLSTDPALRRYNNRITELLSEPLPIREGTVNEIEPHPLELSEESKELWVDFHDSVESNMRDDGEYFYVRGFAAKAPEHAARLATVLSIMDNPLAVEVPIEHMIGGVRLAEFYLSEAVRLFQSTKDSSELILAEKVLGWLRLHYPTFSLIEIYQNGPNAVRNSDIAKKIVKILQDHRLVEEIRGGATIGTNKRNKAWRVVT
jgi:hypothetical protein